MMLQARPLRMNQFHLRPLLLCRELKRSWAENYMDYSSDVCINHFTWGQIGKMWAALAAWRGI
ncbi:hypothetical protein FA15DRAFT_676385 [Coprinopsis marcescibilis]|uniref:Uncharacterized protein n=1 Tax=Coprinopsis marcescibilis TaxID=230819 RepID=A0A5C3KAT8_COPMA|nr:hypothetical protein FA15DRAFT_676385 [Coprinopsis marcescibilis]